MAAGATYEPIATTTLGSATNTITFNSIPSTYTDLRIVVSVKSSADGGLSTAAGSNRATNQVEFDLASSSTAGTFSTIDIFSYAGSTNKTALFTQSNDTNGSGEVRCNVLLWRNTAAITSFTFTTNQQFSIGSMITVYGILAA
jgi:hypothetical protein